MIVALKIAFCATSFFCFLSFRKPPNLDFAASDNSRACARSCPLEMHLGSAQLQAVDAVHGGLVTPGHPQYTRADPAWHHPAGFFFLGDERWKCPTGRHGNASLPRATYGQDPRGVKSLLKSLVLFLFGWLLFIFFPSAAPHLLHLTSNVEKNTETGACFETGLNSIYQIQDL